MVRRNWADYGWLTEASGIQPGLRPEAMRLSLRGYQRGECEGRQLQHCREAGSRPSFLLACPACLCQNMCDRETMRPRYRLKVRSLQVVEILTCISISAAVQ